MPKQIILYRVAGRIKFKVESKSAKMKKLVIEVDGLLGYHSKIRISDLDTPRRVDIFIGGCHYEFYTIEKSKIIIGVQEIKIRLDKDIKSLLEEYEKVKWNIDNFKIKIMRKLNTLKIIWAR
jgi:hypothetical protein